VSRRPRALDSAAAALGGGALWRRTVGRWLPPLVLLAVAATLLVIYQSRFAGRVEVGAQSLERGRAELARLTAERQELETQLTLVRKNRERLAAFYDRRLSTERLRLTAIIAEVKDLAQRSGLVPQSISYPEEIIEDYGLRKRSFQFSVEGTYADLRKLINLLELSDSFLTLEGVTLSGDRGARLRIDLRLSTLFATPEAAAEAVADHGEGPGEVGTAPAGPPPAGPAGGGGGEPVDSGVRAQVAG
jgi:Tfp pilus assembly protein PilO